LLELASSEERGIQTVRLRKSWGILTLPECGKQKCFDDRGIGYSLKVRIRQLNKGAPKKEGPMGGGGGMALGMSRNGGVGG